MIAKIFPRFVVSRVIMNSMYAEAMTCELLKQPLGVGLEDQFFSHDCKKYNEVKFYGYLSQQTAPTNFLHQQEKQAYERACAKFAEFNQTAALVYALSAYQEEVQKLYNQVESNNNSSNLFSQSEQTRQSFSANLVDAIQRFKELQEQLEPYPEWKDKVVEEIGSCLHVIYNNMAQSEEKQKIFLILNKQELFV